MCRKDQPWTTQEIDYLRESYGSVPTREISAKLDRPLWQVKRTIYKLGLRAPRRRFTDAEKEFVRAMYAELEASEIADALNTTLSSVYQLARRLEMPRKVKRYAPEEIAGMEALIREGLTDAEVSRRTGVSREWVSDIRNNRLGLLPNAEAILAARRQAVKTQMKSLGIRHGGDLRAMAYRRYARENGWPEDLRAREVQMLNALAANGPQTLEQLAAAIGCRTDLRNTVTGYKCFLKGNGKGSTYPGNLKRRGLICCLRRDIAGRGKGKSRLPGLYMLTEFAISILEEFNAKQPEAGGREGGDAARADNRQVRGAIA
jgi:hypothetical protein